MPRARSQRHSAQQCDPDLAPYTPSVKAWEVLLVALVAMTAFLVTDRMQPITVQCYSHGEHG